MQTFLELVAPWLIYFLLGLAHDDIISNLGKWLIENLEYS